MRKLTMPELNRLSLTEYQEVEKLDVIIVLDNVRSLSNIGSFFRTADAFRIEEIFLCGITAYCLKSLCGARGRCVCKPPFY